MRSDRFYSVEKLVVIAHSERLDAGDHRVILQACPKVRCLTTESEGLDDSFYDLFEKDSHPVREFHCPRGVYPEAANLLKFRHIQILEIILDKGGRVADDERKVLLGIVMFATLRSQRLTNPKSLPTTIRLRVENPDSIEWTNARDAIRDSSVTLELL